VTLSVAAPGDTNLYTDRSLPQVDWMITNVI